MIAIPLRDRDGVVVSHALIDDEDAWLAIFRWNTDKVGYAGRSIRVGGKTRRIFLHRAVLGLTHGDGLEVDHINRDRLDNRRANLRTATRAQNAQNVAARSGTTSRHRGVCWVTLSRKWRAMVKLDGRNHFLGYFSDEEEAARVASEFRAEHMPFAVEV